MNLKHLRAFREVILTGSVSKAARNLHRTQPAVSLLLASLEEHVGCKLFARRGGRLVPVPEAHYLLEETQDILNRVEAIERNLKGLSSLESGILRLVSMPGPSVILMPRVISRFAEARPNVQISVATHGSPRVQQLIATQQYDVGIADMGFSGAGDSPLVNYELFDRKCLCAIPAGDDLAQHEEITPHDLSGRPLATLYSEHTTYAQTRDVFAAMDAEFNVRFRMQYFIPLFAFVERGQAYTIADPLSALSYRLSRQGDERIVFRPFKPDITLKFAILTPAHRPLSRLAQAFVDELRSEIRGAL